MRHKRGISILSSWKYSNKATYGLFGICQYYYHIHAKWHKHNGQITYQIWSQNEWIWDIDCLQFCSYLWFTVTEIYIYIYIYCIIYRIRLRQFYWVCLWFWCSHKHTYDLHLYLIICWVCLFSIMYIQSIITLVTKIFHQVFFFLLKRLSVGDSARVGLIIIDWIHGNFDD